MHLPRYTASWSAVSSEAETLTWSSQKMRKCWGRWTLWRCWTLPWCIWKPPRQSLHMAELQFYNLVGRNFAPNNAQICITSVNMWRLPQENVPRPSSRAGAFTQVGTMLGLVSQPRQTRPRSSLLTSHSWKSCTQTVGVMSDSSERWLAASKVSLGRIFSGDWGLQEADEWHPVCGWCIWQ